MHFLREFAKKTPKYLHISKKSSNFAADSCKYAKNIITKTIFISMKKGLFFSLIAAVVVLASCNNSLQNPDQITVNPNPLQKVGAKLDADITGTFPAKKFAKKFANNSQRKCTKKCA